jgi:hypothetical protein
MSMNWLGEEGVTPLDADPDLPLELSPEDVASLLHEGESRFWEARHQWETRERAFGPAAGKPGETQLVERVRVEGNQLVRRIYAVNIRTKTIRSEADWRKLQRHASFYNPTFQVEILPDGTRRAVATPLTPAAWWGDTPTTAPLREPETEIPDHTREARHLEELRRAVRRERAQDRYNIERERARRGRDRW